MAIAVKICGIKDRGALAAALEAGATHIGFVFVPASPRHITVAAAADLAAHVPALVKRVGLFVDPDNSDLRTTLDQVSLDIIQLHGHESPERVSEIKNLTGLMVWKAVAIGSEADVAAAHRYESVADVLLFDAKPPKTVAHALTGGNGLAFDWTLIANETWHKPWILSGGLTPETVGEAISISGASHVDVSSGVEEVRGEKSPRLIREFIEAVRKAAT